MNNEDSNAGANCVERNLVRRAQLIVDAWETPRAWCTLRPAAAATSLWF
jgi:hypothetical protein